MEAVREAADTPNEIAFTADVVVRPPSDYFSTIRSGTVWKLAGRLVQGYVYRPVSTVFQVESRHVHEAYLVISGRALIGVYLPVEQAFVSVERVNNLPVK